MIWYYLVHDNFFRIGLDKGTIIQDTINLGTQEATVDPQAGTITADVVNKSGAELPSTGGIGTRIFYTAGAILVAAGVALLIAKKRKAEEN